MESHILPINRRLPKFGSYSSLRLLAGTSGILNQVGISRREYYFGQ